MHDDAASRIRAQASVDEIRDDELVQTPRGLHPALEQRLPAEQSGSFLQLFDLGAARRTGFNVPRGRRVVRAEGVGHQ
jgi:hypothetical protein